MNTIIEHRTKYLRNNPDPFFKYTENFNEKLKNNNESEHVARL